MISAVKLRWLGSLAIADTVDAKVIEVRRQYVEVPALQRSQDTEANPEHIAGVPGG
jgi:hypothetical protein